VRFRGDVLAMHDVHVLQMDMKSYEERNRADGEPKMNDLEGYRFVRVVRDGDTMSFQLIDMQQFARFAETELSTRNVTISAQSFGQCVDLEIQSEIFEELLSDIFKDRLSDLLSDDELVELEQSLEQNHEVDPYSELQKMRQCIAFEIPGEVLGRLFSVEPNESFGGVTIQMAKVLNQ